jgi:MFS family permease
MKRHDNDKTAPSVTVALRAAPRTGGIIAALCVAEVFGMAGFSSFAALLPAFTSEWNLTNTEAGWIGGIYYAGYTAAVPVLVTLTDRIDPRRIYLLSTAIGGLACLAFALLADGFWTGLILRALAGAGLAGTYMPGLKALTDRLEGTAQARAVAYYTSGFGIGASTSYIFTGQLDLLLGWRWAFGAAAIGSAIAYVIAAAVLRPVPPPAAHAAPSLLDFRPVLRNRAVIACVIAYAAHNFELFGFRSWIVAFLAFSASLPDHAAFNLTPTLIAAGVTILSLPGSIIGNEIALKLGRSRTIIAAMSLSALAACLIGFAAPLPMWALVPLTLLYAALVSADSSALTSSVVAGADPRYRGMTMALYSCVGFVGAFLGPLAFGIALDFVGTGVAGWGTAFAVLGAGVAIGPLAFFILRPRLRGVEIVN